MKVTSRSCENVSAFVAHSPRSFLARAHELVVGSFSGQLYLLCVVLTTVPTIVIAHTFWASRDTRISFGWCLLIQGYFCAVQIHAEKAELALGIQKENWG